MSYEILHIPAIIRERILSLPSREAGKDAKGVPVPNEEYLDFVKRQECVGCHLLDKTQSSVTDVHHIEPDGVALKCVDEYTVPFCHNDCHLHGVHSGQITFANELGFPDEEIYLHLALMYMGIFLESSHEASIACRLRVAFYAQRLIRQLYQSVAA